MPWTIVRNLSPEVYRALRARAQRNGRSTDAELCCILHDVLLPVSRVELGPALAALARPRPARISQESDAEEQLGRPA